MSIFGNFGQHKEKTMEERVNELKEAKIQRTRAEAKARLSQELQQEKQKTAKAKMQSFNNGLSNFKMGFNNVRSEFSQVSKTFNEGQKPKKKTGNPFFDSGVW